MCITCNSFQTMAASDPTRTLTLRNQFSQAMGARFLELRREVRESVYTNDCFGLREHQSPATLEAIPPRQYAFLSNEQKVEEFMGWLESNSDLIVLHKPSPVRRRFVGSQRWTDVYIEDAYRTGMKRGHTELKKAGVQFDRQDQTSDKYMTAGFWRPIHADAVGLLYIRSFNELKGITGAMDTQMSRVLAEGLVQGLNPMNVARNLMNRIERVGNLSLVDERGRFIPALRRARMLARTEIIRAHHQATINAYREAEVSGVMIKAEWRTAGDRRVCPECAPLEGVVFTLDEVEGMIPVHPNCRCIAIPANVGEDRQKRVEYANVVRETLGQPEL